MDDVEAQDRVARVESLLEEVEGIGDPSARNKATELVQALLELYGSGLERIVERVAERDDGELAAAFAGDELIAHLLLLHDLHPVPLEARINRALEDVRPYLESHGGDVTLLGLDDGVVRLRLQGSCSGCPSSTVTLKLAIEEAIHKVAPDVAMIEAEGVLEPEPAPARLQLEVSEPLQRKQAAGGSSWTSMEVPDVPSEGSALVDVAGEPILFVRLKRSLYGYRAACPACGTSLEDAPIDEGHLLCATCERRFDVRRAGRSPDDAALHLEPVPLLFEGDETVKVAVTPTTAVA
jgi:Fe-S cluster biogenesis protein NfuA/nitrite reductase/ring-hydroxylating ferredoxin subunit